jgi:hypothetical protein
MPIAAASHRREWMDAIRDHFAYRCLPLVLANQAGWMILNPVDFSAHWTGGPSRRDLKLDFPDAGGAGQLFFQASSESPENFAGDPRIVSHFGHGIVTVSIPYLFRTPPNVNLWVKGPSNYFKDGAHPLEGIVEADWSPATFTMNWKLTRPGLTVHFARGEPICMIVPLPRGLAEGLKPRRQSLDHDPKLLADYRAWDERRRNFVPGRDPGASIDRWQKDYFLGRGPDGSYFDGHQTRLPIKDFPEESEPNA